MHEHYRGWTITYSAARPITGLWRAVRFGVGMCAGTEAALRRMIDVRVTEEQQDRARREAEER